MVSGGDADLYVRTSQGRVPLSWDAVGLLLDNCLYEQTEELSSTREAFATAIGASTITIPELERDQFAQTLAVWLDGLDPGHRSSLEVIELDQLRAKLQS